MGKMGMGFLAAGIGIAMATTPALAGENNGFRQIMTGDLQSAERVIAHERAIWPHDADLLINLAAVYRQTARTLQARQLYEGILSRPDEELTLSSGMVVSAHAIAKQQLQALPLNTASITR